MWSLAISAYLQLIEFDVYLHRGNFRVLYERVRKCSVRSSHQTGSVEQVCLAIDSACIWYWKQVLCLQRSAATVCLLRQQGIFAQLVLGVQPMPFKAHSWVEVDGQIVNDKPYTTEIYAVIDKC